AILIAPGWGTDPLPKGERAAIYYYDREEVVVQNGILKAYADPTTKSIVVEISKNNLYDIESIDQWTLVVAVTSHDGYGTNKIRPFVVGGGEWAVGVPQQYALAMLRNVIPYILDILTPTKEDQYSMLNTFDADKGELAKIRGIFITTGAVLSTTSLMITPTMSSTSTITVSTIPSPTSPSTSSSLPSQSPSPTPSPWQEMPLEAILGVSIVIITMIVAILFVIIIRRTR
ncbi:MAG: glucodextranase DOMON-like domain-containing protein, partial [Ignisphaera sp.]